MSASARAAGSERVVAALARLLPARGVASTAVLLEDGPLRVWLEEAGCPTSVVPVGRTRDLVRVAADVARVQEELCASASAVVLSHSAKAHLYGGTAARREGRPALWWQHGAPGRGPLDRAAGLVPASAVLCGTEAAAARLAGGGRRTVHVVHPGIPVAEVARRRGDGVAVRRRLGTGERPLVGIVGRVQPWKGQATFLEAAAAVAAQRPDVCFVVVGGVLDPRDEGYRAQLERRAQEPDLRGRVHLVGHQPDVHPWFDALDVAVHASTDEPFGLVLLEAMALGTPLVATEGVGPREIVEQGSSGLLVPPGDVGGMASAVLDVLGDPALARRLGEGGRARVEVFDEGLMADRVADLLEGAKPQRTPDRASARTDGPAGEEAALQERTVGGLHDFLLADVLVRYRRHGGRALDLGAGSGALALRLQGLGVDVTAVDLDPAAFGAAVPFRRADLDAADFADGLGRGAWSLVTAVEVIEHLESPVAFLRNVAALLAPGGVAVITTPNVESLHARVKFLLKGTLRLLDEHGDPTHLSPIFLDLLRRQLLPRAGLVLVEATTYPPGGFRAGRRLYKLVTRPLGPLLRGSLAGDNHVLVLAPADAPSA